MAEVEVGIFKNQTYEQPFPLQKTVVEHIRVGVTKIDVPQEALEELESDEHKHLTAERYFQGVAQVPAQHPSGQVTLVPLSFIFPLDIESASQAFQSFDEGLKKEAERMNEEAKKQMNQIAMPMPGDVEAVNNNSGIIAP